MRKINKPDTSNPDPQYWERVLESHGLGSTDPELVDTQDVPLEELEELETANE